MVWKGNVLACRYGKVQTGFDRSVDSVVERFGLAAAEGHVGDGALVLSLAGGGELLGGVGSSGRRLLGGPTVTSKTSQSCPNGKTPYEAV